MKMMMDSSTMDNRNYININNNNMDHNDSLNDTHNDTHDNDIDMNNHHIRIQFQLAKEYDNYIPSLVVPNDSMVVPSNITYIGISKLLNHLLHRHVQGTTTIITTDDTIENDDNDIENDSKLLPYLPFDCIIGTKHTKLFRNKQGIGHEIRQLGYISMEDVMVVTYFPSPKPPEIINTDTSPKLPDWISSIQSLSINDTTTKSNHNNHSYICTGCYDGSISIIDTTDTQHQEVTKNNTSSSSSSLSIIATKQSHQGPIHCVSTITTTTNNKNHHTMNHPIAYIATGSMDHTLHIHPIVVVVEDNNNVTTTTKKHGNTIQFHPTTTIHCMNGHMSSISSLDMYYQQNNNNNNHEITSHNNNKVSLLSGDWDGNICVWEYPIDHHYPNDMTTTTEQNHRGSSRGSNKKSKLNPTNTDDNVVLPDMEHESSSSSSIYEIQPKYMFRAAHTSKVSGISYGNYEKEHDMISNRMISSSYDHTIKVWDIERQDCIYTCHRQRVITCMDTSYHTSGIVVTGHPDCMIRVWDTRTTATAASRNQHDKTNSTNTNDHNIMISDTTFRPSHKEWISDVVWSKHNPYHITSTSYDGTIKLWDIRTSLPIYTCKVYPKDEKGLCVCYSSSNNQNNHHHSDEYIYAGGTDGYVKHVSLLGKTH